METKNYLLMLCTHTGVNVKKTFTVTGNVLLQMVNFECCVKVDDLIKVLDAIDRYFNIVVRSSSTNKR